VEDNPSAIDRVIQVGITGTVYNASGGSEMSNLSVIELLCSLVAEETGLELQQLLGHIGFVPDRPGHDRHYAINDQCIRQQLNWSPNVEFKTRLRRTIHWYFEN
jgi:dTDP-glucose 4,6-dehydratase